MPSEPKSQALTPAETSASVLVVDDERSVRFAIAEVLTEAGYQVLEAASVSEARGLVSRADVVVSDLAMPEQDGFTLLEAMRREHAELPMILLTAHGNERMAVKAMKLGAWDYLTKPFDIDELTLSIERALQTRRLASSDRRRTLQDSMGLWLVGESPAFLQALELARRVAARDVSVLVSGESGTGKEAIASLIHAASPRKDRPLIRFNCAALTESLANAELFGHAKGAFTGAGNKREGFFQRADRGTLVLDEVAELPLSVQAALLRALQQGEVQPVGSAATERVDVRVVACSAVGLEERVKQGRFRADLYYRLRVVELRVPNLEERKQDIPLLVRHFQHKYRERFGLADVPLPEELTLHWQHSSWPGNVRELENKVAEVLALSDDGTLSRAQLDALLGHPARSGTDANGPRAPADSEPNEGSLRTRVAEFERGLIEAALIHAGGNQSQAARSLGTTRTTLIDKMRRLGVQWEPNSGGGRQTE